MMHPKIYLNDANSAVAEAYQLLGARLGYRTTLKRKYKINLYAGADNLLDQDYSLGNDINAAANRVLQRRTRKELLCRYLAAMVSPKKITTPQLSGMIIEPIIGI